MFPYIAFLLCFSAWSNLMYERRKEPDWIYPNYAITCCLVAFCFYFGAGEVRQFAISGWYYFLDPWNYLDILPLCLVFTTATWTSVNELLIQIHE